MENKSFLLQIAEVIIGLVSLGALFFTDFQLAGFLLLCFLLILLIIHYNIFLPQYTIFTHHSILEISDKSGRKAKVSKKVYRRCNHKGITEIVHKHFAADGTLGNFKSDIDPNPQITKEAEEYTVKVRLSRGLKKFQPLYDTLGWDIFDSFLKNKEFWQFTIDYPTHYIKLEIVLPDDRKCIGQPKIFVCRGAEDEELPGTVLSSDCKRIIWEKKSFFGIKNGTRFKIEWNW